MKSHKFKMYRVALMFLTIVLLLSALAIIPQIVTVRGEILMGINVGVALLGLVGGLFFIRRMNHRLVLMADAARSIEEGDYSARTEVTGEDAIGMLARTINSMAERIQSAFRELEHRQHDLVESRKLLSEQNAKLEQEFERQAAFGEYLVALNAVDINAIAGKTLEYLLRETEMHFGIFYLRERGSGKLQRVAERGIDSQALAALTRTEDGFPAQVVSERKWLTIKDIDEQALPEVNLGFTRARLRSVLGVPVLFQQKVLGVLILSAMHKLDDTVRRIVESAVGTLGSALNNAMTYKTVQQQALQLEQANMELLEADHLRSEFVANMSHELRTPLNSIIGFSGLLMKNRGGNLVATDLSYAEKINRNGKHLLNLINDILDLSKIEAGRMELQIGPTRIDVLTKEVVDMLRPQADERNLSLTFEAAGEISMFETDGEKLKRVLINLLGNAIKFTHKGGVKVRLSPQGGHRLNIEVNDSGIGIPQDKLETIFQPFRQVDSSTSREYGGTGLGLTITRSIVEMLRGEISVSSKTGEGSTFTVSLPLSGDAARQPAPAVEEPAAPVEPQELGPVPPTLQWPESQAPIKGARVLVVDDDPDSRELLMNNIEGMGAKVIPCEDGEKALQMALECKPDLITLDLMMPGMDGWEVLSRLRDNPETRHIPVVIISIVANRRQAMVLGAVDALTKPISSNQLQALLQHYVRRQSVSKILVVDDDEDARQLLCSHLENKVGELRTAVNGREALQVLEEFTPDLIFLDLNMPQMDGFTFLRVLRADKHLWRLPVVVVTAKQMTAAERRELERRVVGFIQKGDSLETQLQEVLHYVG